MKHLPIAAALALLCTPALAQVTVYYDRFKDRTEVSAAKPATSGMDMLQVFFGATYPGKELRTRPENAAVTIFATNREWKYLRCHGTRFLADNKPITVETAKHHGDIQRGFVVETITIPVSSKALDALATAQKVEMQLCTTEYVLDEPDLANLRGFVAATKPTK